MAGIGVKLQKIFDKKSIAAHLVGFVYSTISTVAPMFVIIGNIMLMSVVLGYDTLSYARRGLFSGTVLYIFIFSLLTAAPFNAVLSRYMSDVIYEEKYDNILSCYYLGLILNVALSCLFGIPFCVWEYIAGGVHLLFVFTGFCGYIALVLVFYSMLYLSICKDYQKISLYFLLGMVFAFLMSLFLVWGCHREIAYSMLLALTCGFFLTAALEAATIQRYFKKNSNCYKEVLAYFKKYWQLVAPTYDLATCIAMFTNISATIIFISRVEMHFHGRYKAYSEAVTGGRWRDIRNAKNRMFRQLAAELLNLVRIQFIITVVVYLVCVIILPAYGFGGEVLQIYPCLAAGYFILFLFYAEIIFLYYFNDTNGALIATAAFSLVTFLGTLVSSHWSNIWYGMGLVAGSFIGFTIGYFRIRWLERHLDAHIFCKGELFPSKNEKKPSSIVYKREKPKKRKGKKAW